MRKTLLTVLALLFVLSVGASAQNLMFNGDFQFQDPAAGWNFTGGAGVHPSADMSVPIHTDIWSGLVTSWSGNWDAPAGTMTQTVYGLTAGTYNLGLDYYIGLRSTDAWRTGGIKVKVNGTEVFSQINDAAQLWSGDYVWKSAVAPVVITGDSASVVVEYYAHFAEWTWLGTDNVSLTQAVPEPGSILALVTGLAGFGGMIIRRRK